MWNWLQRFALSDRCRYKLLLWLANVRHFSNSVGFVRSRWIRERERERGMQTTWWLCNDLWIVIIKWHKHRAKIWNHPVRDAGQLNRRESMEPTQTRLSIADLRYYLNTRGLAFYLNSPRSFKFLHSKWRKLLLETHKNVMNMKPLFFPYIQNKVNATLLCLVSL